MTDSPRDYSETLFLPQTPFPMRAGLPQKEPEMIQRWDRIGLYELLREDAKGRAKFVLHDGPPYANGNLHIGHALNKILKDVITRSRQMAGFDANYVPGWDCHGLPIEWKIEEQYRARGTNTAKADIPINEFRGECRRFAEHWIGVQASEFRRLGVEGDFAHPYTTMAFHAEARIAEEIIKFAVSGQLYRGSKPVMWSVVEKTALAEAEVEYQDYTSDTVWVKFPVKGVAGASPLEREGTAAGRAGHEGVPSPLAGEGQGEGYAPLAGAAVVIWTTTPWTLPGNRAIAYSDRIPYGLYEVTDAAPDNRAKPGDRLILADALAADVMKQARVAAFERRMTVTADMLAALTCAHPLADLGYGFDVPLLPGEHVTADTGTGFVHTAPSHGREDFDVWMSHTRQLTARGIDTAIPFTVDDDGFYTPEAPGFAGRRVITEQGDKGDANEAVIAALRERGMLVARGRLKHQYPHSWRSKKPVIFRNTPQWFIHMDKPLSGGELSAYRAAGVAELQAEDTLRNRALKAIAETAFYPASGQNRIRGMIEQRPDWVVSRQRAWGVPIAVFRHEDGRIAPGPDFPHNVELTETIASAFEAEGADAWFADGAKERFLSGLVDDLDRWTQVRDILDVWFDSGSTHAFVLEDRPDLKWPADLYLEGSDQHRGWFHSSLLESCGTRGRAPYDGLLTHGFVMDEDGRKMSKSLGNVVTPQDVIKQSGADILRLWVVSSDYAEDLRIGPEILKTNADAYRKLRNTVRWMLGSLAHFEGEDVPYAQLPDLEKYVLHRLSEVRAAVEKGYAEFDFKRVYAALSTFMTSDLSAFYFDIRKDALYCDPYSSGRRKAALHVIDRLFVTLTKWLAPLLPFTAEEAWLTRTPSEAGSVHLQPFEVLPDAWRDDDLAARWAKIRRVRRVVTGALEVERREKRIGSSLEAAPVVFVPDADLRAALEGEDFADICITSAITVVDGEGPADAFRLPDVEGVAVVPALAEGQKCARSWKVTPEVGADPAYPDITPRDAAAMREWEARRRSAA